MPYFDRTSFLAPFTGSNKLKIPIIDFEKNKKQQETNQQKSEFRPFYCH